jgi:rhamnose transport system ATP-binding protein
VVNTENKYILKLENITKTFPGTTALDDVNFDLYPGEVHALIGENGAGKSTLIKIISGIYRPDSGEINLNGTPVSISSPLAAQRYGIAAIYQEPTVFPDLSVAENVFMGHQDYDPLTRRIKWKKMYEETDKLLKSLGVNLNPKTRVKSLSAANQQLVEIVKALSINSRILIMDEPTSALTMREVEELFQIIRHLRKSATSIIYISHRLEETFQIADRVTVLRDGRYIETRKVSDVRVDELVRMMIGRTLNDMFPKKDVRIGEPILRVEAFTTEGQFNDITFELRKGEILGFAGLVGAGRTELARAMFGLEPQESGRLYINGKNVHITNPSIALKNGMAYLPEERQQQGLVLPMNITQNISLPILKQFAKLGWLQVNKEIKNSKKYADMLDIRTPGLWLKVQQLSGGNQQKVVLAKWLATNPQVLILDEPTKGIDVGAKASVHRFMSELAARGLGVMMISSELPEILGMSDRIIVMCEGRITAVFERKEATQDRVLSAAIGISSDKNTV